jgi:hypothetical protein
MISSLGYHFQGPRSFKRFHEGEMDAAPKDLRATDDELAGRLKSSGDDRSRAKASHGHEPASRF